MSWHAVGDLTPVTPDLGVDAAAARVVLARREHPDPARRLTAAEAREVLEALGLLAPAVVAPSRVWGSGARKTGNAAPRGPETPCAAPQRPRDESGLRAAPRPTQPQETTESRQLHHHEHEETSH